MSAKSGVRYRYRGLLRSHAYSAPYRADHGFGFGFKTGKQSQGDMGIYVHSKTLYYSGCFDPPHPWSLGRSHVFLESLNIRGRNRRELSNGAAGVPAIPFIAVAASDKPQHSVEFVIHQWRKRCSLLFGRRYCQETLSLTRNCAGFPPLPRLVPRVSFWAWI